MGTSDTLPRAALARPVWLGSRLRLDSRECHTCSSLGSPRPLSGSASSTTPPAASQKLLPGMKNGIAETPRAGVGRAPIRSRRIGRRAERAVMGCEQPRIAVFPDARAPRQSPRHRLPQRTSPPSLSHARPAARGVGRPPAVGEVKNRFPCPRMASSKAFFAVSPSVRERAPPVLRAHPTCVEHRLRGGKSLLAVAAATKTLVALPPTPFASRPRPPRRRSRKTGCARARGAERPRGRGVWHGPRRWPSTWGERCRGRGLSDAQCRRFFALSGVTVFVLACRHETVRAT